jgi:hypothetical protein
MSNQEEARSSLKRRQRGHVMPLAPIISLSDIGRLRTAHVLALCGISHSVLYTRQKKGTFPISDGKDGPHNFWNTKTIREFLEKPAEGHNKGDLCGAQPARLLKSTTVFKSSQQA